MPETSPSSTRAEEAIATLHDLCGSVRRFHKHLREECPEGIQDEKDLVVLLDHLLWMMDQPKPQLDPDTSSLSLRALTEMIEYATDIDGRLEHHLAGCTGAAS